MTEPRYIVRPYHDGSWIIVDTKEHKDVATSNDRSQSQQRADKLNRLDAEGKLEREK